jgi:DMSO/TMAO reductase YedYZ molybdopterin-dependent catalytic subunit
MSEDPTTGVEHIRELVADKGESIWPGGDENTANRLDERRELSVPMDDITARQRMSAMSRRGFLVGGVAAVAGVLGWRWMSPETRYKLLNGAFRFNERVSQFFYSPRRLAPEFPPDRISPFRVNGMWGIKAPIDLDGWRLSVGGLAGRSEDLVLTLDDIKRLPRVEMITELKCIEGWSVIVRWAGARFADFAAAYQPTLTEYVYLSTPDEEYFVGWDMPSILHPQTLLAYEMNGAPLKADHGAPLRLASPTKYGIKLIKRIGRIEFTNTRPRDFWAQPGNGYDWYSGH